MSDPTRERTIEDLLYWVRVARRSVAEGLVAHTKEKSKDRKRITDALISALDALEGAEEHGYDLRHL